jgi:M6 family metalloprotease-like protein
LRAFPGIVFLLLLISAPLAQGAPIRNLPVTKVQPDGSVINCFASGDEYYNWLHDAAGFTIVDDPATGYYVYAVQDGASLVASGYVVGRVEPAALGLTPNLRLGREQADRRFSQSALSSPMGTPQIVNAPSLGLINNLVVFVRFSGEDEYSRPISTYDAIFNASVPGTSSMYNYYREVSYNQLSITTTFYPVPVGGYAVSYQDAHPRAYYQPYNSILNPIGYTGGDGGADRTNREHALLAAAATSIAWQIPPALNLDSDNDGNIDNICFIIKGQPTGWSSLLWPHMWSLYSQPAYINGKRIWTYNFQLEASLDYSGVGVLCHEMFHSLGAPDLYHYTYDGLNPASVWDIMANNLNPPQHMGAYMKYRYGKWIPSIPTIGAGGNYSLSPQTSNTNNALRINSPNSSSEYFVVEYRKRSGVFESSLQDEGLLVYRINTSRDGQGNAGGPPDEVYIYRPDGTISTDGNAGLATFNSARGRTSINDTTNPSAFLSTGSPGGLNISNVGSASSSISFTVSLTCSAVVSVDIPAFPASGGSGAITIQMPQGCPWKALSAGPWITFAAAPTGSGTASLPFNVAINRTASQRINTLTVAGQQLNIAQDGINGMLFSDITPTNGFYNYIRAIFIAGITNGCGSGQYCPDAQVIREQMAALMIRTIEGERDASYCNTGSPYSDVPPGNTFCGDIKRMAELGITRTVGTYDPKSYVTRGQMAAFIIRAKYGESFIYNQTPYFSDVPPGNTFFKYVQLMKTLGLTQASGSYGVDRPVSRGEMAAFLARAFLGIP